MQSKGKQAVLVVGLIVALSGMAFAAKKDSGKHIAVGTISSMDANQVVLNQKVKGKDQSMTYKLDPATQKSGNLAAGKPVTIQYRTENNQRIATAVRERAAADTATSKPSKKQKAS